MHCTLIVALSTSDKCDPLENMSTCPTPVGQCDVLNKQDSKFHLMVCC